MIIPPTGPFSISFDAHSENIGRHSLFTKTNQNIVFVFGVHGLYGFPVFFKL